MHLIKSKIHWMSCIYLSFFVLYISPCFLLHFQEPKQLYFSFYFHFVKSKKKSWASIRPKIIFSNCPFSSSLIPLSSSQLLKLLQKAEKSINKIPVQFQFTCLTQTLDFTSNFNLVPNSNYTLKSDLILNHFHLLLWIEDEVDLTVNSL